MTVSRQGQILCHYRDKAHPTLRLYDINAQLVASRQLAQRLMDMEIEPTGTLAVAGGFGGTAVLLRMRDLSTAGEIVPQTPKCGSIRAVRFNTTADCVLMGTASGHVEVHPVPELNVRYEAGSDAAAATQ